MSDVTGRWRKFKVLLWVQFARLRTSWRPYLIVSSVMPLGIAILLRAVMNDEQVDEFGRQIVAGSVVLAIAMTAVVMLAQRIAALKESQALDLYETLPVSRTSVVGSVLISFGVFSLPGTIVVVILGSVLFDLSLTALWSVGSFALAGLGVVIGFGAPDEQLAGMYSNLAMMAVLFLGILPLESLPGWIKPLRVVLPSTYAINALEPGLEGVVSATQLWNLLVLAAFGTLSFWAVNGPLWPKGE